MRERGLKSLKKNKKVIKKVSRSREGAWIEILSLPCQLGSVTGRSREGAWIEM